MKPFVLLSFILTLPWAIAGCAPSDNKSRVSNPAGPVSARARNNLAAKGPEAMDKVARSFEKGGDPASALNLYLQAIAAHPRSSIPKLGAARMYVKAGEAGAARRLLQAALIDEPSNTDVKLMLVTVHLMEGDSGLARNLLGSVERSDDNKVRIDTLTGFSHDIEGRFQEAQTYYRQALSADQNAAKTITNYALSQALSGNYAGAVTVLQRNLSKPSTGGRARENLALIYALSGQVKAASSIIEPLLEAGEAQENIAFYHILQKMTPTEKAQAVFLRRLPEGIADRVRGADDKDISDPVPSEATPKTSVAAASDSIADADPEAAIEAASKSETETETEKSVRASRLLSGDHGSDSPNSAEQKPAASPAKLSEPEQLKGDAEPDTIDQKKSEPVNEPVSVDQPQTINDSTHDDQKKDKPVGLDQNPDPGAASIIEKTASSDDTAPMQQSAEEAENLYRIQLASVGSLASASKEWCRLEKDIAPSNPDLTPVIRSAELDDGSVRFRILLSGFEKYGDALARCEALKENNIGCFVVKGKGQLLPLQSDCMTAAPADGIKD